LVARLRLYILKSYITVDSSFVAFAQSPTARNGILIRLPGVSKPTLGCIDA